MEAFNPVETSMKVLKECKIIKEKNPKVKTVIKIITTINLYIF